MQITHTDLNIHAGTLSLVDSDKRTARYRRVDSPMNAASVHLVVDHIGVRATPSLLDAHTFPKELLVKHDSPDREPLLPLGDDVEWSSVFRYVLEEETSAQVRHQAERKDEPVQASPQMSPARKRLAT